MNKVSDLNRGEHIILVNYQDITAQNNVEQEVQNRFNLEHLITTLSTYFINLSLNEVEKGINHALKVIGEFYQADRSYLFLFNESSTTIVNNIYQWCAEGIESQTNNLPIVIFEKLPWFSGKIKQGDIFAIDDISNLGIQARAEKEFLEAQNVKSIIIVPIVNYQSVIGFVGFDSIRSKKDWSQDSICLLNFFGEMLANVLHRQQTEAAIQQNQRKLSGLINSLPGIVFSCAADQEYSMKYMSEGCFNLTGYHSNELIANPELTYNDITNSEDIPHILKAIQTAISQQKPYEIEYRIIAKTGEEKWLWEKGIVVFDQSGQLQCIEGFITDITKLKKSEQALRESEERYRLLAENVTDMIARHSPDGVYLYVSLSCQVLLGYQIDELIGHSAYEFFHPEDISAIQEFHNKVLQEDVFDVVTYRIRQKNGNYIWFETTAKIVYDYSTGNVKELITVSRDITKRKQTEKELKQAETKYRTIFENITQGIFQTSLNGRYLSANPALAKIYGYDSPEELINTLTDIEHQLYVDPNCRTYLINLLEQTGFVSDFESQVYCKNGQIIWISETIRAVYDEFNQFLYYEGTVEDVSARRLAEERLKHDAFHDSLTQLPNRAWFMQQLEFSIAHNHNWMYGVLFIDLDRFKVVNDSLGHLAGDELLKNVAKRLEKCLRWQDKVARFGGDEFAILLENIDDLQEVIQIAERIQEKLKLPFKLKTEKIFTSASIGITLSTIGYEKPEDLLRDADLAMYQAKAEGKGRYVVFDPVMQVAALARLQLENDLRQAIKKQEFSLYYQPIVDLTTEYIIGFEALLRWKHPLHSWISPADFIPIAEETGLINSIGWWVFQEACCQLDLWKQKFPKTPLIMNINISPHQLKKVDLVKGIESILQIYRINGSDLKLEITESCFLETVASETAVVEQIKSLGIGLCIDDFGTGYSSLSRLHEFPLDTLKIDRSFINLIEFGQTAIVQTIVTLAHSLGMNIVAEGIETKTQLEKLKSLGCELGQGYFFSKPVDSQTATQLLSSQLAKKVDSRLKSTLFQSTMGELEDKHLNPILN